MKQFIVLTVVLLAVQSIQGTIVNAECSCKAEQDKFSKDEIIKKLICCINECDATESLITKRTEEHNALLKQNDILKGENCKLSETLKNEKQATACAIAALEEARAQIAALNKEIAALQKQLSDAQAAIDLCNKQKEACRIENESLKCTIAELNAKIKQLQEELCRCETEEQNLKNQLEICNRELINCQTSLNNCETEKSTLKTEIARLETCIANLRKTNAECADSLNTIRCSTKAFLNASKEKECHLTTTLESGNSEILTLKAFFDDFRTKYGINCITPCQA